MSSATMMAVHPAAALFPMLPDSELQDLAEDIQKNGLLEPIVMHDGMILDGRNRLAACDLAGIEPRFVEWEDTGSATVYVMSKNMHRRHLTVGQRAIIAFESLPLLHEEARQRQGTRTDLTSSPDGLEVEVLGSARSIAANGAQISETSLQRVIDVHTADPEEYQRIKRGETKVATAHRKVKGIPDAPKITREERIESIRSLAAQGYHSSQIAGVIGMGEQRVSELARAGGVILPHEIIGKIRRLDVNRIIDETVIAAQNLITGLDMVDDRLRQIDASHIPAWVDSLRVSIGVLNRLMRQLQRRRNLA